MCIRDRKTGGAADLLAACLFLDRLPAVSGGWAGSL
ncbi:hypothetical protein, partial [Pseudomonas aeruginosa]